MNYLRATGGQVALKSRGLRELLGLKPHISCTEMKLPQLLLIQKLHHLQSK